VPQKTQNKIPKRELKRLQQLLQFEESARFRGFQRIAGIDEAGRGPLAGPVLAAACIVPADVYIVGVDDSKKLTPKKRAEIYAFITSHPRIHYAVGEVSSQEIDRINIYQATIQAMLQALEKLPAPPDYILVDGMRLPHPTILCEKIVQGDALSQSIAAASIIAKETRDRLMCEYHAQWPDYGFNQHKGYGTEKHLEAIQRNGPCPIHRMTFSPLHGQMDSNNGQHKWTTANGQQQMDKLWTMDRSIV
jgi:ribonuclease HII